MAVDINNNSDLATTAESQSAIVNLQLPIVSSVQDQAVVDLALSASFSTDIPTATIQDSNEFKKQISAELKAGRIPDWLIQEKRLVDPQSKEGLEFQKEIEAFARKYFSKEVIAESEYDWGGHDFDAKPIRFILSCDSEANACAILAAKPPIVILNKGIFTQQKGMREPLVKYPEDLLAYLVHEITHIQWHERLKNRPNDKLQEGHADLRSIYIAHETGLSPQRVRDHFEKCASLRQAHRERVTLDEIFDVHVLPESICQLADDTMSVLRLRLGMQEPKELLADFKEDGQILKTVFEAKHLSFVDISLSRSAYSTALDVIEKLNILTELVPNLDPQLEIQADDLKEEILKLKKLVDLTQHTAQLDLLANTILDRWEELGAYATAKLYFAVSDIAGGLEKQRNLPLGRLKPLAEACQAWVTAVASGKPLEIKSKSIALNQAIAQEPILKSEQVDHKKQFSNVSYQGNIARLFLQKIDFPQICVQEKEIKKDKEYKPWRALINATRGNKDVLEAAIMMGFWKDSEITFNIAKHDLLSLSVSKFYKVNPLHALSDYSISSGPKVVGKRNWGEIILPYPWSKSLMQEFQLGMATRVTELLQSDTLTVLQEKIILEALFVKEKVVNKGETRLPENLELLEKKPGLFFNLHPQLTNSAIEGNIFKNYLLSLMSAGKLTSDQVVQMVVEEHTFAEKSVKLISDYGFGSEKFEFAQITIWDHLDEDSTSLSNAEKQAIRALIDKGYLGNPYLELVCTIPNYDSAKRQQIIEKHLESLARKGMVIGKGVDRFIENVLKPNFAVIYQKHTNEFKNLSCINKLQEESSLSSSVGQICINAAVLSLVHSPKFKDWVELSKFIKYKVDNKIPDLIATKENLKRLVAAKLDQILKLNPQIAAQLIYQFENFGFLSAEQKRHCAEKLEKEILGIKDQKERVNATIDILSGKRIPQPEIRATLVASLVSDLSQVFGKENKNFDRAGFKSLVRELKIRINKVDYYDILSRLADQVESQPELSQFLAENCGSERFDLSSDKIQQMHLAGTEMLMTTAVARAENKKLFLDFLLKDAVDRQDLIQQLSVMTSLESADSLEKSKALRKKHNNLIQDLYANFWSSPLAVRALILERLLVTGERDEGYVEVEHDQGLTKDQITRQHNSKLFEYAVNILLPGKDDRALQAKSFVAAHIDAMETYQQKLSIAALSVASEKAQEGGSLKLGKCITLYAENMGPAETKAVQRAGSHPFVDHEIREETKNAKYKAARPARWEIIKWFEAVREDLVNSYNLHLEETGASKSGRLDQNGRVYVKRIGAILGSGSMAVAIEVQMSDQSTHVVALKRPYVEQTAQVGFVTINKTVNNLGQHPAKQVTAELCENAQKRIPTEANFLLAKPQYQFLNEVASADMTIDGITYQIRGVGVSAYGENFYMMSKAQGKHFLEDFESSSSDPIAERKRVAMVVLTKEINNILRGKFEADRHGGQFKINAQQIRQYDAKAVSGDLGPNQRWQQEWTKDEYKQFAQIIFETMRAAQADLSVDSFVRGMLEQQKAMRERGIVIAPFVTEAQQALLALGDFAHGLSAVDFQRVIASAFRAGISNEMQAAISEVISAQITNPLAKAFVPTILDSFLRDGQIPAMAKTFFGDSPLKWLEIDPSQLITIKTADLA